MTDTPRFRLSERSYLGAAMGRPENQIAALVTAVLIALALIATQIPESREITVDFAEAQPGPPREVALTGFKFTPKRGWRLTDETSRVVFHRNLPKTVELEIEARREDGGAPAILYLDFGGVSHRLPIGPEYKTTRVTLVGERPDRVIEMEREPGANIQISRMIVMPVEAPR